MSQLSFLEQKSYLRAPNVASVPQYSPLRYPGGKTWLYPFAKKWLLRYKSDVLIELFAGGASVGLAAAIENLVKHVILVEKDEDIVAIWKTIINGDALWLADKIKNFDLNQEAIKEALKNKERSVQERAFAVLLMNRISHGGILANGSGRVKNGENGKGIKSRWYPTTLCSRILNIANHKDKINVIQGEALDVLESKLKDDVLFFIDPPYTIAGRRLYNHFSIDHEKLFSLCDFTRGSFLMTYDKTDEIEKLAQKYDFQKEDILMQTTHMLKKFELVISKDLSWLYF